ncbi:MFS transporter, putative [Bodo saltans]|uniref:MFS transporter, putative n=1 Tax=Bodo saltans TaxID=75058 RepID=A0A0S4KKI3_BODSA|nr:MFS transporter, putative [Bodo saltans]|eukprot:CUI14866.1 MFS transporter, putative [Bodo saltans]
MIGCAVAGHLFTIYSAKLLLLVSLVIHGFFTFLFASAESYEFALLCRFFIGTTLAFIVVYTPVWVDEFSPKSSAATWMALQNAGVPIGIMIGFVIGGLMPTYTSVSWEWSFYFKSIVMVPIVAIVAKTERSTLDSGNQAATNAEFQQQVNKKMEQVERARAEKLAALAAQSPANSAASGESIEVQPAAASSPKSPAVEAISQAVGESLRRFHYIGSRLMRNSVWVANMLSLSSLYFVVSGLQTFVTSYLRDDPFNASMETITIGFGCAVVTAPVFGVVAGGILLDRIGGYHGNLVRASRFALMWGVCAAFFAVICIFLRTTLSFLLIVWVLLFCGGAIIPPGSGINMASLPQHLRPSGSSVAQMSFNFLGNFSGPLVCGWVAEWTGSLAWGIRAVLCMGVVGVIPMSLSAVFATRRAAKQALVESANAQAALRRQQQQQQHQQQQQQQLENDDANAASGYHSDSSEEFGVGGRHAVGAPTPGDHHYYTSNMSIMAALEEAVEAKQDPLASSTRRSGHESPRHADSDIELMSFVTGAGNNNQRQSGSSDRTSPAGAGNSSFRPASNNNNNNNSNNGIIAAYNSANLFADSVGIDVVSGAASASGGGLAVGGTSPQRTTPHLKSNGGSFRGTPHSTTSMRHKQQQQQDPFSPLQANNSTSGPPSQNRARSSSHRSQSTPTAGLVQILPAGDEDDSGDAGIIARGMCGVYTSSRRPTMAHREVDDDDDGRDRSDALDSAQFNMSFPYQHSFGMDVVRGLLNLESPQIRSASIGNNNNNNNNNNPARSTPTPPPLASANSPQLRPAAGTPLQQFEQESPPLPSLTRRKSSRQASGESSS